LLGSRKVIALTSTPAARLYQTTSAELRNPAGRFVAPDADGLLAAAAAMTPTTEQSRVVRFDPTSAKAKTAKDAYPLAIPVYAALNPKQTDASLRADYAKLITYAVGAGQTAGTDNGQLPPGYAPLPTAWRAQATSAAAAIKAGALPVATPTPSATSAATSPTASAAVQPTSQPQPGATDPSASGNPNPGLLGAATAADPGLGGLGGVVPATGLVGLAAALAIPLTSRFRRSP